FQIPEQDCSIAVWSDQPLIVRGEVRKIGGCFMVGQFEWRALSRKVANHDSALDRSVVTVGDDAGEKPAVVTKNQKRVASSLIAREVIADSLCTQVPEGRPQLPVRRICRFKRISQLAAVG